MSQKINPISFRLGLLQVWNEITTTYNKKTDFQILTQKNIFEKYLKSLSIKTKFYLGNLTWVISPHKIFLLITYVDSREALIQFQSLSKHLSKVLERIFKIQSSVYLVKNSSWINSSELLKSYLISNINQTSSLKNVIRNTTKIICTQLGNKKSVYTSKGPLTLKLIGFRFKLSGRFDNSRNQMTKTIKYENGSLPMPNMNIYSEYSHIHIYTKSGVCGLGIWLTYTN